MRDQTMELVGERVRLRTLTSEDLPLFAEFLRAPSVKKWWGDYDEDRLRRELVDDPSAEAFAVEAEGHLVGMVDFCEETYPDYYYAALDITLGVPYQGQGLGSDALRTLITHLVDERGHHRLTVDPAAENTDAAGFYEKLGFRKVGIMRKYERVSDEHWRDGLLMELIVETDPHPCKA